MNPDEVADEGYGDRGHDKIILRTGGHRVYVGIRYPRDTFYTVILRFRVSTPVQVSASA